MFISKTFINYNVIYAIIFRCDMLLPLFFVFSLVVFYSCSCALTVIGLVAVMPTHHFLLLYYLLVIRQNTIYKLM
jgi:hypothetical protein